MFAFNYSHGIHTEDLRGSFYIPLDAQLRQLPKTYVCYDLPSGHYRDVVIWQRGRQLENFLLRGDAVFSCSDNRMAYVVVVIQTPYKRVSSLVPMYSNNCWMQ